MAVAIATTYKSTASEPRIYPADRLQAAGYADATRGLPSVTTILGRVLHKPAFVPAALKAAGDFLADRMGERITQDIIAGAKAAWGLRSRSAMDVGTRIHQLAEAHGRGEAVSLADEPQQVRNGFEAYIDWLAETGFVATEIERVVADPVQGYAGCCDAVGVLRDGTRVMVDWKSSKAIYDEYILQWHAYAAPLHVTDGFVVRFDKETGECEHLPVRFDSLTYEAFLACVRVYEWMTRGDSK